MYSLGAKNDLCREPASHLLLVLSGRTLENRELIPKPQHHVYTQNTAHVTFRRLASNCFITITYTIWGFNLTCSMHMHSPVHLRKKSAAVLTWKQSILVPNVWNIIHYYKQMFSSSLFLAECIQAPGELVLLLPT